MPKQCYWCGKISEYYEECEECGRIGCQDCIEKDEVIFTKHINNDDYKQICINCEETRDE